MGDLRIELQAPVVLYTCGTHCHHSTIVLQSELPLFLSLYTGDPKMRKGLLFA